MKNLKTPGARGLSTEAALYGPTEKLHAIPEKDFQTPRRNQLYFHLILFAGFICLMSTTLILITISYPQNNIPEIGAETGQQLSSENIREQLPNDFNDEEQLMIDHLMKDRHKRSASLVNADGYLNQQLKRCKKDINSKGCKDVFQKIITRLMLELSSTEVLDDELSSSKESIKTECDFSEKDTESCKRKHQHNTKTEKIKDDATNLIDFNALETHIKKKELNPQKSPSNLTIQEETTIHPIQDATINYPKLQPESFLQPEIKNANAKQHNVNSKNDHPKLPDEHSMKDPEAMNKSIDVNKVDLNGEETKSRAAARLDTEEMSIEDSNEVIEGPDDGGFEQPIFNFEENPMWNNFQFPNERSGGKINIDKKIHQTTSASASARSSNDKDIDYRIANSNGVKNVHEGKPLHIPATGSSRDTYFMPTPGNTPRMNFAAHRVCWYEHQQPPPGVIFRSPLPEMIRIPEPEPEDAFANPAEISHRARSYTGYETPNYGMYDNYRPPVSTQYDGFYNTFMHTEQHSYSPPHGSPMYTVPYYATRPTFSHTPHHQPASVCGYLLRPTNFRDSQDQPPSQFRFADIPVASQFTEDAKRELGTEDAERAGKMPDILYGEHNRTTARLNDCQEGERACYIGTKCVSLDKFCNGEVDCTDGSDESMCTCKDRIDASRLCDGYFDCPLGEDEMGCFGCPKPYFSCQDVSSQSTETTCYSLDFRCDDILHCLSGKDEQDCIILSTDIARNSLTARNIAQAFSVSYTEGYLNRNYKGNWYPVCKSPDSWPRQTCVAEIGVLENAPYIERRPVGNQYKGNFLNVEPDGLVSFSNNCFGDKSIFVRCPNVPCGTRLRQSGGLFREVNLEEHTNERFKRYLNEIWPGFYKTFDPKTGPFNSKERTGANSELVRKYEEEINSNSKHLESSFPSIVEQIESLNERVKRGEGRVVGGSPSAPAAWPWVVALYRNGVFHCGGALINRRWVLTAAHCVSKYYKYYFEVQLGMLRRFSFSPQEQTISVSHVILNELYDRADMKNDLALLRLAIPAQLNRWVRPICLPNELSAGNDWLWGPEAGTSCMAVGWGATEERGPDPDHMREVEVPVLKHCKQAADRAGGEICAGVLEGGRDACQGDSGGPLLCKNPNNDKQWYVAGVVSHGEGCARPAEPGAYTRVSLFTDWITEKTMESNLPLKQPILSCPGFQCLWGVTRCISAKERCNKIVDCLGGEDEINCQNYLTYEQIDHIIGLPLNGIDEKGRAATSENNSSETTPTESKASNSTGAVEQTTPVISSSTLSYATSSTTESFTEQSHANTEESTIIEKAGTERSHESSTMHTDKEFYLLKHNESSIENEIQSYENTNVHSNQGNANHEVEETDMKKEVNEAMEKYFHDDSDEKENKTTESWNSTLKFHCKKIKETIPMWSRCNHIVDCEDGTDEEQCSCREYLEKLNPSSICNGFTECADFSDEEGCVFCKEDEFHCRFSRQCIPLSQKCNQKNECTFKEDEMDCLALTEPPSILIDVDGRPHLNAEGIVTISEQGVWTPICEHLWSVTAAETAGYICSYLGFSGYEKFEQRLISKEHLDVQYININQSSVAPVHNRKRHIMSRVPYEFPGFCTGLYVKCRTQLISHLSNTDMLKQKNPNEGYNKPGKLRGFEVNSNQLYLASNMNYNFPWNAFIYVDGHYKCAGVILDHNWILIDKHCLHNVWIELHYTIALMGSKCIYPEVMGPHEQIRVIDHFFSIMHSFGILLHMKDPISPSRYVFPIFLPEVYDQPTENDACVTIGLDHLNLTQSVFLSPEIQKCGSSMHRCFKRSNPSPQCQGQDFPWSGVVVCRGWLTGWHPAAIYHQERGKCGFQGIIALDNLAYLRKDIKTAMSTSFRPMPEPTCRGFRCPLGRCLRMNNVCDGIPDCRDGSDELHNACEYKKRSCLVATNHTDSRCSCRQSELRCNNGKCIPKTFFCNGVNDCGDNSDEPDDCTCGSYLRLTAPHRMCDGNRNCFDKTDEDPLLCACQITSFKCGSSGFCVPQDFVCDGFEDCPDGEDEKKCYGLSVPPGRKHGHGEAVKRSYGIWHTRCFPEEKPPTSTLEKVCSEVGYNTGRAVISETMKPITPVTAIKVDLFRIVQMDRWAVSMRKDGPLCTVEFSKKSCNRLFVECY